jgi:hypothetical protein
LLRGTVAVVLVGAIVVAVMMLLGDGEAGPEITRIGAAAATSSGDSTVAEPVVSTEVLSPESAVTAPAASQTVAVPARAPGVALLLTEGDMLTAVVVLQPRGRGVVSLGMPADTLVRVSDGFKTVLQLHTSGDIEALVAGLETILGVMPAQVGSLEIEALRNAVREAGSAATLPSGAGAGPQGAREAAEAVLQLVHLAVTDDGAWEDLPLAGDASAVRESMAQLAAAEEGTTLEAAVLPGRQVEGDGFAYYEADVAATRLLVDGTLPDAEIMLDVQNGSGTVGAAEAAADLLAPLESTLLPFANAPSFPDVEDTVISAASGTLTAAHQVRALLGVGEVVEDESLPSGHVVVVVGKDFIQPRAADGSPSG